ncbi:MAG: MBL fold metallo-hydrolase, partial [Clostridia bacterium]|nr:MBL fold metallo-hydrolase [Clostridia bacterium]
GFHLYNKSEEYVRKFASRVRETGIEKVITGHCTGDVAFGFLKEELKDMLIHIETGLVLEF